MDKVIDTIASAAATGKIGDGKIWAQPSGARGAHPHRRTRHGGPVMSDAPSRTFVPARCWTARRLVVSVAIVAVVVTVAANTAFAQDATADTAAADQASSRARTCSGS